MTAYATIADMEANIAGWVTENPEALDALLEDASREVDRLLGARPTITEGDYAGLKVDPTELDAWQAQALARATTAQAAWMNQVGPDDLVRGTATKTSGPTFSVERAPAPGGGRIGPAVPALVTATRLKRSWAPMTPSAVGPPGRH